MFLAAAPYFQTRFESSDWILKHFQSAIITVSTVANLGSMLILTKMQREASYPKRIIASLVINMICFTLLAISTSVFRDLSADGYFGFLMAVVLVASLATGFCQNGVFAFVSGFGVSEYTQGIMTGQAVAGVLPCIVQIISVLSVPERDAREGAGQESPKSAFAYFMTATGVSAITLVAFLYLLQRHRRQNEAKRIVECVNGAEELAYSERKVVGMVTLFKKLRWLAMGVIICFAVTIASFPVFTAEILSVNPRSTSSRFFSPACFIPLAFLVWNVGDLAGRLLPLIPKLSLVYHTPLAFVISTSRVVFIPLYLLCNIRGRGAIISSDIFYLFVVQFLFGLTNGYIGSSCMMGASEWVADDEREAAGGFMGLMLVVGLTVGSLLSFLTANA
jgi:equilibrative nucleoside transporter 1/2/3